MPEENESGYRLAGRLYATLRVLKFLATPGGPKPTAEDEFTKKDSPLQLIQDLRLDLVKDLLTAAWGDHPRAAGEVLRALPDVIPPRTALKDNLGERPLAEFNAGHRAQVAALKETLPGLL